MLISEDDKDHIMCTNEFETQQRDLEVEDRAWAYLFRIFLSRRAREA